MIADAYFREMVAGEVGVKFPIFIAPEFKVGGNMRVRGRVKGGTGVRSEMGDVFCGRHDGFQRNSELASDIVYFSSGEVIKVLVDNSTFQRSAFPLNE